MLENSSTVNSIRERWRLRKAFWDLGDWVIWSLMTILVPIGVLVTSLLFMVACSGGQQSADGWFDGPTEVTQQSFHEDYVPGEHVVLSTRVQGNLLGWPWWTLAELSFGLDEDEEYFAHITRLGLPGMPEGSAFVEINWIWVFGHTPSVCISGLGAKMCFGLDEPPLEWPSKEHPKIRRT